jgi:hypothetical protein
MRKISQALLLDLDEIALEPSEDIYSGVLSAGVEQTVAVPPGASIVIFAHDDDIWANWDTTAALPTGSISEAGGELNPHVRRLVNVLVIHLIAERDTKVSLSFYG